MSKVGVGVGIDLGTSNCRVQVAVANSSSPRPDLAGVSPNAGHPGGVVPVSLQYRGDELVAFGAFAAGPVPDGVQLIESWKPSIGQHPDDVQGASEPGSLRCRTTDCPGAKFAYPPSARVCMFCQCPLERAETKRFKFSRAEALKYSEDFLVHIWRQVLRAAPVIEARRLESLVCIGHPVHWGENTREVYAEMLSRALFPYKIELIPEPTAALYHGVHANEVHLPAKVLVIDFGAGTTDFCVTDADFVKDNLRLTNTDYYGEDYGGRNFDALLMGYAAEMLKVEPSEDLRREWLNVTKKWKERLSNSLDQPSPPLVAERFPLPPDGSIVKSLPLERPTFELVCGSLVTRFKSALDAAMAKCCVGPEDIDVVLTTGGGARWFFVQDHLQKVFGPERISRDNQPELSNAIGLALAPLLGLTKFRPADPRPPETTSVRKDLIGYLVDLDYPEEGAYRLDAPRFQFGGAYGYDNHVVLKNPDRVISRKQAEIFRNPDGTYELNVISTVNPTMVDKEVVKERVKLKDGSSVVFANRNFRFELREEVSSGG